MPLAAFRAVTWAVGLSEVWIASPPSNSSRDRSSRVTPNFGSLSRLSRMYAQKNGAYESWQLSCAFGGGRRLSDDAFATRHLASSRWPSSCILSSTVPRRSMAAFGCRNGSNALGFFTSPASIAACATSTLETSTSK